MTDDIRALLEELREIDIDTWKDVRFHLINIFSVNDLGDINLRSPLLQNAYSDIIQGCIQRTIAAHPGWYLCVVKFSEDPDRYHAMIEPPLAPQCVYDASTPVAALLAAYIQARKAMR